MRVRTPSFDDLFEVTIASPGGAAFQKHVARSMVVGQLVRALSWRLGHPPAALRLVFGLQPLEEDRTIGDYDIQAGNVLTLIIMSDITASESDSEGSR